MPALNSLQDPANIVTFAELANNHGTAIRPELFYSKQLLDTIRLDKDHYVHYRLADTTPIQGAAEKLQVRRWAPLQAHTVPLVEGVPPVSDKGSMESYEIPCFQYGRYMEFTDKVDFEVIDPVIAHYTREYSLVAMETLDLLARDTLLALGQSFFAGGRSAFSAMQIGDKPTLEDLRSIVLTLKKQLVKPRMNSRYQVIGTPDFFYDMVSDPTVEKFMSLNQTTKTMYDDGMLVPMFSMEFYETQAADMSGEYIDGAGKRNLRVYRFNTNTKAYEYANLAEDTYLTVAGGYHADSRTGQDASYDPELATWDIDGYNATIVDGYGDYAELKIHPILVVGKDALITTGIAGESSAKMYVKQKGSAGVLDPIDQRQSIGFKINSVGFGSSRLEAIAVYYCVPENANLV